MKDVNKLFILVESSGQYETFWQECRMASDSAEYLHDVIDLIKKDRERYKRNYDILYAAHRAHVRECANNHQTQKNCNESWIPKGKIILESFAPLSYADESYADEKTAIPNIYPYDPNSSFSITELEFKSG